MIDNKDGKENIYIKEYFCLQVGHVSIGKLLKMFCYSRGKLKFSEIG